MFTTLRIRRPVWPRHVPSRTCHANVPILSSTACTCATTSTPSTTSDEPRGIRSDVQHRPVFGDVDVLAGEHRIDTRAPAARFREQDEEPHRLAVDPVLGVVEMPARGVDVHPVGTLGVGGKQRAQIVIGERRRVRFERPPLRKPRQHGNSRGTRSKRAMPPHRP